MGEDESYKYYPFPNTSIDDNLGERYIVPPLSIEFDSWQEWIINEVKEKKICSEDIMEATDNEKLLPIKSPDRTKVDTFVFGFNQIEYQYLHAIKEEKGYNYIYRVYLQYLRDEMSQGIRSPRVLRVASHIDEEEQTLEMWRDLSALVCNELETFLQQVKIEGYLYYDIYRLDQACQLLDMFEDASYIKGTLLQEISSECVKILFRNSQERIPNLKVLYNAWRKKELEDFFNSQPLELRGNQNASSMTKPELISYMIENGIMPKNFETVQKTRCGPVTVLIDNLSSFIEKILKIKIDSINNQVMSLQGASVSKIVKKTFDRHNPEFHSKNINGHDNNSVKNKRSLNQLITRASENLTNEIIKILVCDMKWLSIQRPDEIDLEHWRNLIGLDQKNKNTFYEPNIYSLTKNLLEIPGVGGSEIRRRNRAAYDKDKHRTEQHSIFRHMIPNTKQWMYCQPVEHKPNTPGGYIKRGVRNSVNKSAVMDKMTKLNVKDTRGEWAQKYPRRAVIGDQMCEALNNLQNTQWEINSDFLNYVTDGYKITHNKVLRAKWQTGNNVIQLSEFMNNILTVNEDDLSSLPDYRVNEIHDELKTKLNKIKMTLKSCFKIFRNSDNVFWHRWSCDYRGRLYPANSLSPHGNDFNKALIQFKEWLPLGESGWKWLKIHVCNLLSGLDLVEFFITKNLIWEKPDGFNKKPFNQRYSWTERHIDCILHLKNTLEESETQKELELTLQGILKPKSEVFQRIAVIIEFARVYEDFQQKQNWDHVTSGLPIHLDASCNGFQHAAALLEDKELARMVNLLKPLNENDSANDLYNEIAVYAREMFYQSDKGLRAYLNKHKKVLNISDEQISFFANIYTRDLVKRPTISIGYGAGAKNKNFFGLIGLKDDSPPPRDRYHMEDWKDFCGRKKTKKHKLTCHLCKSEREFKTEESIINHLQKTHSVEVWHIESPLFKSLTPELQNKITKREWPSRVQLEIAEKITMDIHTAIQEVTNQSFKKINKERLKKIQDYLLVWTRSMDKKQLEAIREKFNIKIPDEFDKEKITAKELRNIINQNSEKINRSLISWDVTDEKGIRIVNFKLEFERVQLKNSGADTEAVFLNAYNLIHPEHHLEDVEDVFKEFGIEVGRGSKTKHDAKLAQSLLSKMIYLQSSGNSIELNKCMKQLFDIGCKFRAIRLENSKIGYKELLKSITPNFIQSLDAGHMRNSINSMAKEGIRDYWSVHDSFGTHACNIEIMRKIVNKEFVNLHKNRNIEYWCNRILKDWNIIRNPELEFPSGELDFDEVTNSQFLIG